MANNLSSWVTDSFPGFVEAQHPQFKLFLEAYYEYLERQNDSESNNAKEIFRSTRNAGGVINDIETYRDVDTTLTNFIQYFQNELLPIAVDNNKVTDAFFLKKVRELYLAKGTQKSFRLLFGRRLRCSNDFIALNSCCASTS